MARRLWAALALALASGCMTESLSPQREQGSVVSPPRKQGTSGVARWKNPAGEDTAVAAAKVISTREVKPDVVPAQLKLPEINSPADPNKKKTLMPEVPSASALLVPAIPPPPGETPVDLRIALAIAANSNPTIGLAQEAARAALAERSFARALPLPTLNTGMNYRAHSGNLLSSSGIIRYDDIQSLYAGFGSYAKGADTVAIPGVRIYVHLGEAIFEPRIAAFRLQARSFDSVAVRNQVLLDVVERFFDLQSAEARLKALRQLESELAEIVRLTANFAKAGQGREGDAQRAQAEAHLLHTDMDRAEEEGAVAAAQLAGLLSMDPSIRLHADPDSLAPILLVDENCDVEGLLQMAASNRPEVGSRIAELREAQVRLRQERTRPLLPLVSVGFSYGTFGGGGNVVPTPFGNFSSRTDFDVLAVWSLQNLGLGNRAINNRVRSNVRQAMLAEASVLDTIGREVTEYHAQIAAARQKIEVARRQLRVAEEGFQEELARTKNLQGRLIEVLNSLNQLRTARVALIQAIIDFNQAQFRLFVALGQPPLLP